MIEKEFDEFDSGMFSNQIKQRAKIHTNNKISALDFSIHLHQKPGTYKRIERMSHSTNCQSYLVLEKSEEVFLPRVHLSDQLQKEMSQWGAASISNPRQGQWLV